MNMTTQGPQKTSSDLTKKDAKQVLSAPKTTLTATQPSIVLQLFFFGAAPLPLPFLTKPGGALSHRTGYSRKDWHSIWTCFDVCQGMNKFSFTTTLKGGAG